MTEPREKLSATQVRDASLEDWRQISGRIKARFRTGDFQAGLALVNRIGAAAEAANHHPDIQLTYSDVIVTLASHDVRGITSHDLDLARPLDHRQSGGASSRRLSRTVGADVTAQRAAHARSPDPLEDRAFEHDQVGGNGVCHEPSWKLRTCSGNAIPAPRSMPCTVIRCSRNHTSKGSWEVASPRSA